MLDRPLGKFLADLADGSPVPGGGSAAAIATAMAAGLLAMTARASVETWPEARAVAAQAEALRDRVAPLAQLDAEAYVQALELLRGEGAGDPERRDLELGAALTRAAHLPLQIAEAAADVAALGLLVVERGDAQRRPDAEAAVLLADAAARIGAHLVRVNLTAQTQGEDVARVAELVETTASAAARALGER
jgi:methenyltetrahydrofolate cyclohydrolase